jgi:hypothetical protein
MSEDINESIPTARKKLAVAHQEVRDEVEKEKEQKEKERLARIEKHNQEVEKRAKERRGTLGNLREKIREVFYGRPPENTGQDTES